jgi:hypothetical protein
MIDRNQQTIYVGTVHFPDGRPLPEVVTEEEAIVFLRLDIDGPKDARRTLKHYRDKGSLHGTRIGKHLRYSKTELLRFIDEMTERTAKKNFKKAASQPLSIAV